MPETLARVVRRCLHTLAAPTADAELLGRFARHRDEAAFAELVARHGPVVLGVCRRVLGRSPDADDVFQATFLLLACNARSVRDPARLSGWLHRVALRVARRARARRRPMLPLDAAAEVTSPREAHDLSWREGLSILDEELNALPDRLRAALVLCYLDGLTRDEAAGRLGWSLATLKRRLEAGRGMLRARLIRRGVSTAVVAAVAATGDGLRAAVPAELLVHTARLPSGPVADAVGLLTIGLGRRLAAPAAGAGAFALMLAAGTLAAVGLLHPMSAGTPPVKDPSAAPVLIAKDPPRLFESPLPVGAVARLGTTRFRHTDGVNNSALSADGKTLVTTGSRTVIVWDTETGERKHEFRPPGFGRDAAPGRIAISPDGKLIGYVTSSRARALVWDTASWKSRSLGIRSPEDDAAGRGSYDAVTFSAVGKELFLLTDPGVVVFDLATGMEQRTVRAPGRALAVAPKAPVFLVRVPDPAPPVPPAQPDAPRAIPLAACDLTTGKDLSRYEVTDGPGFSGLATLSADGRRAAAVAAGDIHVWDTRSGKAVTILRLPPVPKDRTPDGWNPTALALSANGQILFTGWTTGDVRSFDLAKSDEGTLLGRHLRYVTGVHASADGQRLVTAGWDGLIRRWDLTAGKELPPPDGYTQRLALARSPDGMAFAVGALSSRLDLYDATGRLTRTLRADGGGILRTAFAPDGRRLAAACADGALRFWETETGNEAGRISYPKLHRNSVPYHISFSPDGRRLLTSYDGARVWDVTAGKEIAVRPKTYAAVAFSPDGKWIVGVGPVGDQRFTWFDAATGRAERGVAIEPLPGGERSQTSVSSVAFTADGRTVVSAHDDGAIRVWDAVASRMTHRIAGAGTRVWWAQPSPDGRWLASGSEDGTVRVWELATGAELRQWDGHDGAVWDGVWGRDSRTLLTTAGSEAVLWSLRPPDLKPSTSANALWDDLVAEPAKAYRAQWNLLDDPKSAAKLLRDRQDPEKAPPDVKQVRRLISDLDSDNFRVREQAMKALRGLGKPVVPSLRDMQKAAGAEGGKRIGELIAEMTRALAPNDLRQVRAIQVLELAATPEAVAVLKEWAGGLPGTLLTDEAAAALKRMGPGR